MAVSHYENFPVASLVMPERYRAPVAAIYWFAREADDIADEGDASPHERLAGLAARREGLDRIARGDDPGSDLFRTLATHIRAHDLPLQPFYDLLDAFRQDVTTTRYPTQADVLDYCRRSANPVGTLMLHLYGSPTPENLAWSDQICSSLQLINFLQDIASDFGRGRIYLPQEDLERFGIAELQIAEGSVREPWWTFMRFQIDRARAMLHGGSPLGRELRGRLGLELRLIIQGGDRILEKLVAVRGDVFRRRPVLGPFDWPLMFFRALAR
jgi:squalene synthase HpnC